MHMDPRVLERDMHLEHMVSVVIAHGPFAFGDDTKIRTAAEEWLIEDFSPEEADEWLDARCFEPNVARRFVGEDILPQDVARQTMEGNGAYSDTVAYKVCNLDLDFEAALDLLRG